MKCAVFMLFLAVAAGCGDDGAAAGDDAGAGEDAGADTAVDASYAPDAAPGDRLGSFQLTYYWVTTEEEFTGPADTTIYTSQCVALASVPRAFADSLRIEGTGRLADGRIINVNGTCMCMTSPCYREVDAAHPWGYGVQNRALVPFRSVAVDRTVIPIGTSLYIAEVDGVMMPGDAPWGNFRHDGCVRADDVGGGIQGMQIDFFAALRIHYRTIDPKIPARITVYRGGAHCP